jgi:hypothetical protein
MKETAFKQTSIRRGVLSPIEYRGAGGQDELFWAGVIETCHSVPNWRTIGVRYGDDEHYLHNEMYQLDDTGKEPAATALQDPTQPKLEKVTPGGNPFDRIKGVYAPRCFLQAQNFEQQALQVMAAEPVHRVRASAAIVTSPQLGSADLTRFYSDNGCAAP